MKIKIFSLLLLLLILFNNVICAQCTDLTLQADSCDFDGDSILNIDDIDDDNDGVLDFDEGHTGFGYAKLITPSILVKDTVYTTPTSLLNGDVVNVTSKYTGGSAAVVYNAGAVVDGYLYNSSTNNGQPVKGVQVYDYSFSSPQKYIRIGAKFNEHDGVANSTSSEGFRLVLNGSSSFHVFDPANISLDMHIDNGIGGGITAYSRFGGYYTIFDPVGISSIKLISYIYYGATASTSNAAIYQVAIGSEADLDTDNDGVFNRFDIDSDDDGCFDTYEAGVPYATNDGSATDTCVMGPYTGNGLADTLKLASDNNQVNYTPTYSKAIDSNDLACPVPFTALPVAFLSFEATVINKQFVACKWITATEINNDYFSLEKSTDGEHWEFVSNIEGAGNSNKIHNYEDLDYKPYNGMSYYRLKQTDFDGQYAYSNVEAVEITNESFKTFKVYPNPTNGLITIFAEIGKLDSYKILSIQGKDISSLAKVSNADANILQLDISLFTPGVYLLKVNDSKVFKVRKL